MAKKFESVRVFEDDVPSTFGFQVHNSIEFVVEKSKLKQFMAKTFGNIYNVGTSRFHDGLIVYRPQSYRDFLLFLKNTSINSQTNDILVYKMEKLDGKPAYTAKVITNGAEYLIELAKKYLKDISLSLKLQQEVQSQFVQRCYNTLAENGINIESSL